MHSTRLFILPAMPKEGATRLTRFGSMRPPRDLPVVVGILDRARRYREDWLESHDVQDEEIRRAAFEFDRHLRALAPQWPRAGLEDAASDECFRRSEEVARSLVGVSVGAILRALAVNWLTPGPENWGSHDIWGCALRSLYHARPGEVRAVVARQLEDLLHDGRVEPQEAEGYRAALGGEVDRDGLDFPYRGPCIFSAVSGNPEYVTLDFKLRCRLFDPPWLLAHYSMGDDLAKLDVGAVKAELDSLTLSADPFQRRVARLATRRSPSMQGAFRRIVLGGGPDAWQELVVPGDDPGTIAALRGLIDAVEWEGRSRFWHTLGRTTRFHVVLVEEAISEWRNLDDLAHSHPNYQPAARDAQRTAIAGLLAAAMRSLDPATPPLASPDEYAEWFAAHPLPK